MVLAAVMPSSLWPQRVLRARIAALLAALLGVAGCSHAFCYLGERQPRFYTRHAPVTASAATPSRLRIVSFNIALAKEIEAAVRLLRTHPRLRGADVLMLQEMDELGTATIAAALGFDSVYYPAVRHAKHDHNFGNAVLSRWPIVADRKLVLPGRGFLDHSIRTATVAEISAGSLGVTLISTHLSTPFEVGFGTRREQLLALSRVAPAGPAIVGGDFNDPELPSLLSLRGFDWLTREVGGTARLGRSLDHICVRGLALAASSAGKVQGFPGISDHVPVYAEVELR